MKVEAKNITITVLRFSIVAFDNNNFETSKNSKVVYWREDEEVYSQNED